MHIRGCCNISVEEENKPGSSRLNSIVNKTDTAVDKEWNTAKKNFKEEKEKLKDRLDKNSAMLCK